jgi:uncharacterized protein YkuJ
MIGLVSTMRELHSRVNDGVHVRLLWCERNGRVIVAVNDTKNDEAFSIDVPEGKGALHVFNHPFAYV